MAKKYVLIIVGLILLAVGVGVTVWGIAVVRNAMASSSWPTVTGTVTASDVERQRSRSGTRRNRRKTSYRANVAYEYSVDETKYASDQVSFGEYASSNPNFAQQIVNRYPKGKRVEVHYDPQQPEVAVLEPGASWSSFFPLGFGLIFSVVGAALCITALFAAAGQPGDTRGPGAGPP